MAAGAGTRRVVLLFAVLAGLFLMHGLNAPAMHGMPMPMPVSRSMPVSTHAESAMSAGAGSSATVSSPDAMPDPMQASMTCIPLRPEGMASLFLALLLVVITLWRPRPALPARTVHPHWPHGPPRTGTQILRTLSISRT
jgi:hypothetical protein